MWREEHLWNASVLHRTHLANLVFFCLSCAVDNLKDARTTVVTRTTLREHLP
jgi:hypothetical protein